MDVLVRMTPSAMNVNSSPALPPSPPFPSVGALPSSPKWPRRSPRCVTSVVLHLLGVAQILRLRHFLTSSPLKTMSYSHELVSSLCYEVTLEKMLCKFAGCMIFT